jgi:selenide,water dikinase
MYSNSKMKPNETIRLTQTVQKGGCAAKVAAMQLRNILSRVRFPPSPPELMIGAGTFDDAAVYRLPPGQASGVALVQTLDFFTPIVDTPYLFGRIAAANAMSDVYAMGGRPVTAMGILAFPITLLDSSIAVEVLQGASDAIKESGASLVGGHTIDDDTLKFGLSVTGFVDPEHVWSNAGARPGDVLILTKPLGTGTLTAALKRGEVTEAEISDGIESMCQLNEVISLLSPDVINGIHAATDITGFALAGHSLNLARASHVSLEIEGSLVPRFERAMELLEKGFTTKAHRTNREYLKDQMTPMSYDRPEIELFFDPQTSGGLLLAVDSTLAEKLIQQLSTRFKSTSRIGSVRALKTYALELL